jgi:hypothetical protein
VSDELVRENAGRVREPLSLTEPPEKITRTEATPDHYVIRPHGRFFAVYEVGEHLISEEALTGPPEDKLVVVAVYKKGAEEVIRRLTGQVVVRTRNVFWKRREGFEGDAEFPDGAA